MKDDTYYRLLGVEPDAPLGEIAACWRKFVRRHHPDVDRRPQSVARFQEVARAWETLRNPSTRRLYDLHGPEYATTIPTTANIEVLDLYGF